MRVSENAEPAAAETLPRPGTKAAREGFALGALGVLLFSLSFPATKVAVEDLDP